MGDVIVTFKLTPDEVEAFDQVKEQVEKLEPKRLETEPIAFGLNAVKATFLVPEISGKMDELEDKLNSLEHVAAVEVVHMTRSL